MLELNKIYNEDCLQGMTKIPNKSINLIVIDPPYNIGKDYWDNIDNYVEWMGKVFKECERVLKDNGSFYFFHNDFEQMAELQVWLKKNTEFKFKSLITWEKYQTNKQYYGRNILMQVNKVEKRNYKQMNEYLLFYVLHDNDDTNPLLNPIKEYLRDEIKKVRNLGFTDIKLREMCDLSLKGGGLLGHYWGKKQWSLPTEEHYKVFQQTGFFTKPYYRLKEEYMNNRYIFNFVETDITTTWLLPPDKKQGHITPKPIKLIEKIILHSSRKDDIVLDCFMGSGSTAIAAINTNRRYIGIERDITYFNLANKRIEEHLYDDKNK
jgi:DNA modification methylase